MWSFLSRLFGGGWKAGRQQSSQNSPSASTTNSGKGQTTTSKSYPETRADTPNRGLDGDKDYAIKPKAVILHHSDGSYLGGVSWILSPKSKVSYHVLIARDGRRTVFADDNRRCWHAGTSEWNGKGDLNSWSLGLSWEGNTYETPLGEDAIASGLEWLVPRMKKWGIPMELVLTHQQIAPKRKTDIALADAVRFRERLAKALK
jgi:N-acetylmuramoyl-L-alanine amidase